MLTLSAKRPLAITRINEIQTKQVLALNPVLHRASALCADFQCIQVRLVHGVALSSVPFRVSTGWEGYVLRQRPLQGQIVVRNAL